MKACVLGDDRTAEWQDLVSREGSFSLTQSIEWGSFKKRLGWTSHRVGVEDEGSLVAGAQLLTKRLPTGLSLAYVPRGPIGRWLEEEAASRLFPSWRGSREPTGRSSSRSSRRSSASHRWSP